MINAAVLRITNNNINLSLEKEGGIKTTKSIGIDDLREIFNDISFDTDILPVGTRMYIKNNTKETVLLEVPESIRKVKFGDEHDYDEFNVPTPWTLWELTFNNHNNIKRLTYSNVYALKHPILNRKTELFKFPFSNVSSYICWGDSVIPDRENLIGVSSIPDIFYDSYFNYDLDNNYEPIKIHSGIFIDNTFSFFRHFDGEKTFPYDCLRSVRTLDDLIVKIKERRDDN